MTAASPSDNAGVLAPPPLVVLGFILLGVGLERVWPTGFEPSGALVVAGWALIAVAVGLTLLAARTMRRRGTPLDPRRSSVAIVDQGPYGFSRNPIYLGFMILYMGLALTEGSVWPFLLVVPFWAVIRYGVIAREERYLERKFGGDYLGYKARVRRWL